MVKKNLIITARVIGRPEPEVKWFKYVLNKYMLYWCLLAICNDNYVSNIIFVNVNI